MLIVAQFGAPVLRRISAALPAGKLSPQLKQLSAQMMGTMLKQEGVGLAAPQVSRNLRLFVMKTTDRDTNDSGEKSPSSTFADQHHRLPEYEVCVNPTVVTFLGSQRQFGWEGCLSVPEFLGYVPRSEAVEVEYSGVDGSRKRRILEGLPARIFQHELDHLDGILYLDRLVHQRRHLVPIEDFEAVHGSVEKLPEVLAA